MKRFDALCEDIITLLESDDVAAVTNGIKITDEIVALLPDDPERALSVKSHLLSQYAYLLVQAGETERGFSLFYALLKWDLNRSAWRFALDDKVRDRHLGTRLELCEGFLAWVEALARPPDAPVEAAALETGLPSKLEDKLLLVAGRKNYAGVNENEADEFAPGRRARIAILLHWGVRLKARHKPKGSTMLHHLAALDDVDAIRYAVSRGAEVDARDHDGRTPLFWAAERKKGAPTLVCLVQRGADVDAVDGNNRTALFGAAFSGSAEGVTALIELGADPDFAASEGFTALEMAARCGNGATAQALLDGGATALESALKTAEGKQYEKMAALLKAALALVPAP